MSQWGVQIVIGRLLTDEVFRRQFEQCRRECLASVCGHGIDLDRTEIAALVEADARVWTEMASQIDRRLRQSARQDAISPLTTRQQRVLRGIVDGLTNKQIAEQVGASEPAVKATLQQLFRKTRVRTRAQLVRVALVAPPAVQAERMRR
jgi:two-component system nitrate/nitrite response regulator NarL